jgi:hypothetical protein
MSSFLHELEYKPVKKLSLKYKYMDVKNNFDKLKKFTFTIATLPSVLKTIIDGKHEVTRDVAVGDFVIRGSSGDIYSTTADRFFMSYKMTCDANVIPIEKHVGIVSKKFFNAQNAQNAQNENNTYITFNDVYGKEVKVYPNDGIIKDKNPKTGVPEFWRIDKKVLKTTYAFL